MKNYVVGILNFFDNEIKLFKIEAEDDLSACKKALIDYARDEDKQWEIDYQQDKDYPKTVEELDSQLNNGDMTINVIEI